MFPGRQKTPFIGIGKFVTQDYAFLVHCSANSLYVLLNQLYSPMVLKVPMLSVNQVTPLYNAKNTPIRKELLRFNSTMFPFD